MRIQEEDLMKIRYIGPKKSILVLAVGIIICWAAAGNASEQWDAKASVRVNLRRTPSLNAVILSIVPKAHNLRIIEKKGLWCKVDVEGEIHGKGWVYAEYLEEILPKALKTESSSQTVKVEITSGEQKQGFHPAEPPLNARTEGEELKPLSALSKVEIPMAGEPVHVPPAQPPYSGFTEDALEISGKYSSEVIEQGDSSTYQKSLAGEKKKHGGALQGIPPAVSKQSMSNVRAVASSVIRSAVSRERKGLINKRKSLGPVAIALKLLSIVMSCLVILLLYKIDFKL